jgi:excisionase family DNA binding protein
LWHGVARDIGVLNKNPLKKGGKYLKRRLINMRKNIKRKERNADDLLRKEGFETNGLIKILTRNETADFLRVHPSTISRYAQSGELKSFKLGSRRLFRYDDILLFFENQVDLQ